MKVKGFERQSLIADGGVAGVASVHTDWVDKSDGVQAILQLFPFDIGLKVIWLVITVRLSIPASQISSV